MIGVGISGVEEEWVRISSRETSRLLSRLSPAGANSSTRRDPTQMYPDCYHLDGLRGVEAFGNSLVSDFPLAVS